MSLQAKLLAAATAAAQEATLNERGRCLWCADQIAVNTAFTWDCLQALQAFLQDLNKRGKR